MVAGESEGTDDTGVGRSDASGVFRRVGVGR